MNTEELNKLLGKYYNGTSSSSDEALLREFFSNDNIPVGYEAEKAMFTYFSEQTVIPEPSDDFDSRIISELDKTGKLYTRNGSISRFMPFLGIAATILIIFGVWFFFKKQEYQEDTFKDPQIAYAETMKVLFNVSRQMNHTEDKLKPVAKMNEVTDIGFEKINKSTILIEEKLRSLYYMQEESDNLNTKPENK